MRFIIALFALAASMAAPVAYGHGFWLLPSSTVLSEPDTVTFDAAVTNDPFHFDYRPLQIDALVITAPDGSKIDPFNVGKGALRTTFDAKLEQKGTYHFAIVREGLRANWKEGDQNRRFMGSEAELDKNIPADARDLVVTETFNRVESFVTVGVPSKLTPSGRGLETVASTHPNDLVAGEPLVLQFLVDGKPAAGVKVEVVKGQTRYRDSLGEQVLESDQDGKVSVDLPTAGMYWLGAKLTDDKVAGKRASKRALAYMLTLEVLPQ